MIKTTVVAEVVPGGAHHLVQLPLNSIEKVGERWFSFRVGIPQDARVDHNVT